MVSTSASVIAGSRSSTLLANDSAVRGVKGCTASRRATSLIVGTALHTVRTPHTPAHPHDGAAWFGAIVRLADADQDDKQDDDRHEEAEQQYEDDVELVVHVPPPNRVPGSVSGAGCGGAASCPRQGRSG